MIVSILEALQQVPFLSELPLPELEKLAASGCQQSRGPGETVFRAGDTGDCLYVIMEGNVRVIQESAGQQLELARLGAGDYFGEMALIDGAPRSATVETLDACEFFLLGQEPFLELLAHSPRTLAETLRSLTAAVRHSNQNTFNLLLKTERQRAEAELERHRSISQMVAGVAHEINTPLGIINQAASVIADYLKPGAISQLAGDNEDAEETLTDIADAAALILSNSARARDLVTTFKNLSVQQVTAKRESADIGQLVQETAGLYRFKARASRLQLDFYEDLGQMPEDRVWQGFPGYLSQIILNLLANVDRYAYPDGQGGQVEIALQQAVKGSVPGFRLSVTDFGTGIPEGDLAQIFNPFFTTGRSKGGTGLGLAIVYNFVTGPLQGEIQVESSAGQGTRFSIWMPKTLEEHQSGG